MTVRAQRPDFGALQSSSSEFPPVNVKPSKLKSKGIQYPSGNALGTDPFPAFGDKLRELMMAGLKPPSPKT
jgi:hypothetical protein